MDKKVFVDFDDTIVSVGDAIAKTYNETYRKPHEKPISPTDTSWSMGLSSDTIDRIFQDEDFYRHLEPIDGAIENLQWIRKKGYEIIIFSKGTLGNILIKTEWLNNWMSDIVDGHIFLDLKLHKSIVNTSQSIMIDDSPQYLAGAKHGICCLAAGEKQWNKDWKGKRFYSWKEIKTIFTEIESFEHSLRQ